MEGQRHGQSPKSFILHELHIQSSDQKIEEKKAKKKRSGVLERVYLASRSILTDILIHYYYYYRARWRYPPIALHHPEQM